MKFHQVTKSSIMFRKNLNTKEKRLSKTDHKFFNSVTYTGQIAKVVSPKSSTTVTIPEFYKPVALISRTLK